MQGKLDKLRHKGILTAVVAIAAVAALTLDYFIYLNPILKWAIVIAVLMASGELILVINGLSGGYGMYMLGSRHGINFINLLSKKHQKAWVIAADIGLVLSLGVLALFIFRKRIDKRLLVAGIVILVLVFVFVFPNLYLAMSFINIPQVSNRLASASSTTSTGVSIGTYALAATTIGGGFATLTFGTILYNAAKILYGLFVYIASLGTPKPDIGAISSQIAGVAPVIPGLTMPLAAGLIALVILLIVHEFSHGVLARIAKVKLKAIGLVLFGIVPAGAYVEPNEKEIKKLSKIKQERIFVAGVTSNIILAVLFFALMLLVILFVLPHYTVTEVIVDSAVPGAPAYNIISPGSVILAWNGYHISNLSSFEVAAKGDLPFSRISVVTNKGSYSLIANQTGKIGVLLTQETVPTKGLAGGLVNFVYAVIALSFLLNFLVAIVNLLPIPGFDGWQIYKLETNEKTLKVLGAIVVVALIVNILPWFFY